MLQADTSRRSLAIVATRGTSNSILQLATLVRAATALEMRVDVLFADAALAKLRPERLNEPEWSPIYAPVLDTLVERLRAADFVDMDTFLREAKEHGDHVHFLAETASLAALGLDFMEVSALLDGRMTPPEFAAATAGADARMCF